MFKIDAEEAYPLLQRATKTLLAAVPSQGLYGSSFRTACWWLYANADRLVIADAAGPQIALCFTLAQQIGATQPQLASVRTTVLTETPVSLGARLIMNTIVRICLATEGTVIANMTFVSRDDVDALRLQMNDAFNAAEEVAADDMDQMTYRALVALHGGITTYLVETARPLPRLVPYVFATIMPSLVMGNRLYPSTRKPGAARADELRAENKVIHPAFMPPAGRALSQ
jgi:prophage DNA circulation protein